MATDKVYTVAETAVLLEHETYLWESVPDMVNRVACDRISSAEALAAVLSLISRGVLMLDSAYVEPSETKLSFEGLAAQTQVMGLAQDADMGEIVRIRAETESSPDGDDSSRDRPETSACSREPGQVCGVCGLRSVAADIGGERFIAVQSVEGWTPYRFAGSFDDCTRTPIPVSPPCDSAKEALQQCWALIRDRSEYVAS